MLGNIDQMRKQLYWRSKMYQTQLVEIICVTSVKLE